MARMCKHIGVERALPDPDLFETIEAVFDNDNGGFDGPIPADATESVVNALDQAVHEENSSLARETYVWA